MKLLHLSDTHFGAHQPQVVRALVSLARQLRPDVAVLSGDLTQRARPGEFVLARQFVEALDTPVCLVIPGNHDLPLFNLWTRLRRPYAGFQAEFGPDLEPELDLPGLQLTAVDTTRWWRHQQGAVSDAQVARVAARLRQAPVGAWRIVVSHHPFVVAAGGEQGDRPWGHARALAAWREAGLDLLLSGHQHVGQVTRSPTPGVPGASVMAGGAASATSWRSPGPNGVTLWSQRSLGVGRSGERSWTHWQYLAERRRFVEVAHARLGAIDPMVSAMVPPAMPAAAARAVAKAPALPPTGAAWQPADSV
jgi:3',5'-cyclic AMP phosphodiesterase CpdA